MVWKCSKMCFGEASAKKWKELLFLCVVFGVLFENYNCQEHQWQIISKTRIIQVKQGLIQGLVTSSKTNAKLQNVEIFLGIPYAAPPVGTQRFMPPGSPPPWRNVLQADRLGYVCPQKLPNLSKRPQDMSPDRERLLRRLLPFLKNQNEDCLYLNIYAPARENPNATKNFPVIVFIHGESFEWNSGNPYDGSILASFGEVIVVTLNFRLGILGFLRPGVGDHTLSNFGLLDQLAALQWIKDNIKAFGGDENSVTLMGYDTGAACVNYLMVSPVSQGATTGLFHRAILMSGTALADWALTVNPIHYTVQVANALNCPDTSEEMPPCLRRKRLQDIMAVKVVAPQFRTPFGPVIDGTVVPNEPSVLMTTYKHLFSRYEMMYGLTEVESYHLLDGVSLAQGMLEEEKSKLLKDYIRAKYEALPNVALGKTIGQYTNLKSVGPYSAAEENRNIILSILSDARVAAPLVQTANFHSQANPKSYFYVFRHRSKLNEYRPVEKSVHGEEMQYIFGIPLDSGDNTHYSSPEKALSEYIMTLWSNFAKTGNPNAPRKYPFTDQRHREWRHFDIQWPEYNIKNQSFLSIGIPPKMNHHYRYDMMKYWNEMLPDHLKNPSNHYPPYKHYINNKKEDGTDDDWIHPRPIIPFPPTYEERLPAPTEFPPTYVLVKNNKNNEWDPFFNFSRPDDHTNGQMDGPGLKMDKSNSYKTKNTHEEIRNAASSLTLSIIIFVGICFLLVNVCVFIGLFYQRDKLKVRERIFNSQYHCGNGSLSIEDNDDRYTKASEDPDVIVNSDEVININNKKKITGVKSILKSSEGIYEPVNKASSIKTCSEGNPGRWQIESGVTRQASSSTVTMDPHTKVREWIAQEIKQRCSPKFLRKNKILRKMNRNNSTDTYADPISSQHTIDEINSTTSKIGDSTTTLQRSRTKKVSVAIDATPATRSPSVLQQIPIELTKSLDNVKNSTENINNNNNLKTSKSLSTLSKRPSLQRSDAVTINLDDTDISNRDSYLQRSESISLGYPGAAILHSHSISDPSPMSDDDSKSSISRLDGIRLVTKKSKSNNDVLNVNPQTLNSFSTSKASSKNIDVNVTSRDDLNDTKKLTSHEDALDNIKRRNFPKVLPDFPDKNIEDHNQKFSKRRSLPPTAHLIQPPLEFGGMPTGGISPDGSLKNRIPPPPPPRISTLGRKPVNTSPINSSHITVHLANKNNNLDNQMKTIPENNTTQVSSNTNKILGSIPVKTPQVPTNTVTNNQKDQQNIQTKLTEKSKRNEPKVIIKPTMTNPITSSALTMRKDPSGSNPQKNKTQIPRVTQIPIVHSTDIQKTNENQDEAPKTSRPQINKQQTLTKHDPNMGIGKKIKINPVKKTGVSVSTETAVDSVDESSESNTGTIKRVKK